MSKIGGTSNYVAFGLTIKSALAIPELIESGENKGRADVSIHFADLQEEWERTKKRNGPFSIAKDKVFFRVEKVAVFLIEKGEMITISPQAGISEDKLRLYILGTCMGIILLQRKVLPLHGSAVEINGKAYAIVGDSGAGKSTLASKLIKEGAKLISDDVIAVDWTEEGIPVVRPAYPQQKLWQESLDHFQVSSKNLKPIIDRELKYAVPVMNQFTDQQFPLTAVFELIKSEGEELRFKSIEKFARLSLLSKHTYRNFIIEEAGLMPWHFQTTVLLTQSLECYQIERPKTHFTVDEVADYIQSTIKREAELA